MNFLIGMLFGGLLAALLGALEDMRTQTKRERELTPLTPAGELDPGERHWVKRGPAGGR